MHPSIIFMDEGDSILSKRSDGDNESSRKLKTEFLIQMDGLTNNESNPIVIIATNRPWEIDDAILRRLQLKINVPMPNKANII
mmetsp:Transcript_53459/g.44860  ORF Transcript_53459/g.44860 Transcript_53459/m.44860 type:complete len:83 (-) Transcript_53459:243-491(-)